MIAVFLKNILPADQHMISGMKVSGKLLPGNRENTNCGFQLQSLLFLKNRLVFSEKPFESGSYQGVFAFLLFHAKKSMMSPNVNMPRPDHRLMLMPSERVYNSLFPFVKIPKRESNNPRIENIRPIGNFISIPIMVG